MASPHLRNRKDEAEVVLDPSDVVGGPDRFPQQETECTERSPNIISVFEVASYFKTKSKKSPEWHDSMTRPACSQPAPCTVSFSLYFFELNCKLASTAPRCHCFKCETNMYSMIMGLWALLVELGLQLITPVHLFGPRCTGVHITSVILCLI